METRKAPDNLICPICGKSFHRKPYTINKAKWKDGICCSRKCSNIIRRTKFKGEANHQYGLRGEKNPTFILGNLSRKNNSLNEVLVYVGDWHKDAISGRVKQHRYLVEQNHALFGDDKFDKVGDWYYLKKGFVVHHIDHNHNNNDLNNLQVISKSEHTRIHNLDKPRPRNLKGQFIS